MIYGYARVPTHGRNVDAQWRSFARSAPGNVFQEIASGAKGDRAALDAGDMLVGDAASPSAGSPFNLLHTLRQITECGAGFKSLTGRFED